ncbi:MAG TPA: hypothetical protein VEK74_08435, partial [Burkholderiaceae bacterium]|nr:hypothetical protein [Burkholderiaceae bacterium]
AYPPKCEAIARDLSFFALQSDQKGQEKYKENLYAFRGKPVEIFHNETKKSMAFKIGTAAYLRESSREKYRPAVQRHPKDGTIYSLLPFMAANLMAKAPARRKRNLAPGR